MFRKNKKQSAPKAAEPEAPKEEQPAAQPTAPDLNASAEIRPEGDAVPKFEDDGTNQIVDEPAVEGNGEADGEVQQEEPPSASVQDESATGKKEKKSRFGRNKKKEDGAPEEVVSPKKSPEKKSRFGKSKKAEEPASSEPAEKSPVPPKEEPVEKQIVDQPPKEQSPKPEPPKEEPKKEEPAKKSPEKKQKQDKKKAEKAPKEESPKKAAASPKKESESPKKEKKGMFGKKKQQEASPQPKVEEEKQQEETTQGGIPAPLYTKRVSHQPNLCLSSDHDARTIKHIVWQNQMKVILISDPLSTKSVISVDVGIGNLHSPRLFDGLATFVQHMVLVGSDKFPEKKKNDAYFKQFGGNVNAFTGLTNTNFQLEIDHDGYAEGVERLASFLVSPTFNQDELDKEIKQIGHKFKRAVIDDETKHLNLWMRLSNKDSIANKLIFAQKDKCHDPETMEAAKQFYDAYYSSSNMTLCMSSNLALNDLEKVAKSFKEIKFKKLQIPFEDLPVPYGPDECRRVIRMHSDREEPELRICWSLPSYANKIQKMQLKYFVELFGHQGPRSIIAYLKKEGLARSLDCRKKTVANMTKFDLVIALTAEGYSRLKHVCEAVFQFAHNLREAGPQEGFANEINALGKLNYDFQERSNPLATCIKLSGKARKVEEIDLPNIHRSSYVRELFDPKLIRNICEMFCDSERVMIFIHSNEDCSKQEKYMNTMYEPMEVPNDFWEAVQSPGLGSGTGVPDTNGLVAHSFDIKPFKLNFSLEPDCIKNPIKLDHGDSWYMQDYKFKHPKSIVQLQIKTRDLSLGQDAKAQVFANVWKQVVLDYASEIIYAGSKAGMTFYIEINAYDIQLYWRGYSMNMPDFIAQTLTAIIQVQKGRSSNQALSVAMSNANDWLKKDLDGANAGKSYRVALDTMKGLIVEGACSEIEMQKLFSEFDMDGDFASVKKQFLKHGHCTWFVHGNLTFDEANNIVSSGNSILGMKETPYERLNPSSVALLQEGTSIVYQVEIEPTSFDTHLSYYQFGLEGRNIKSSVLNTLLQAYMEKPLYEELKGTQGMAKAAMRETSHNDCTGMWLLAMSDKHSAEEMNAAINDQLLVFQKQVKSFSEKDFKQLKSALHKALTQNPKDLAQDNERFWQEILSRKNQFNRPARMAKALQEVTRDEFIGHFETLFFSKSTRRLDVQMLTKANKPNQLVTWGKNENHPIYKSVLKRALFSGTFWEFKTRADYYPDAQLDTFKKGGF